MNAIVSLGGCSASFVSPQGLIATNHHCVYGSIQYNSKPGQDYLTDGFLAKALGDELPGAPGTRAFVIEDLRDVTREMTRGLTDRMSGLDRTNRLDANRKALIARCERQPNRRCDVRAYFGGSQYWLQQQLEVQDVRLVYAPAGAIGNFGGEIDNWQWPRHTGDFAFYRAYVAPDGSSRPFDRANVPFQSKAWLRVAREGLKEGDFVLVAGFPGVTERHRTAAETRAWYERIYPRQQQLLSDLRAAWLLRDPSYITRYIRPESYIAIYLDGQYAYSLPAQDYIDMTRDAIRAVRTEQIRFYRITKRGEMQLVVRGEHQYIDDATGVRRLVYIQYTFEQVDGRWYLIEAGSSANRL